jgi:hypothetical protein
MDIELAFSSDSSLNGANVSVNKDDYVKNFKYSKDTKVSFFPKQPQFDSEIVRNEVLKMAYFLIIEIVKESRKLHNVEITAHQEEEDRNLIERLVVLLKDFKEQARLRQSEMIIGLIYLQRIRESHKHNTVFHSTNYVDMIFYMVCCILISHKISQDVPYNNYYWSKLGNLNIHTINACELHCLDLLNYNTYVDSSEYSSFSVN